ncbi:MAG: hypothetical protein QW286_02370 [Candidatus Aenigmatarchaeota archaeon]
MKGPVASGKGEIEVLVFSDKDYSKKIIELSSSVSSSFSRICYVTLNKPSSVVSESLKKSGVSTEKFFFVDCTGKPERKEGQAVYVSSPKALTEMSITITKVLELGKVDALIFDSLSTLMIYEEPSVVLKFFHSVLSSLRSRRVSGFFVCLKGGTGSGVLKDISMFADRVVE